MPTDIKLDQNGGGWLLLEGDAVKATSTDFMLDAPSRRRGGGGPLRRALVHDFNDGLTINWAGDYPGGVTVTGNLTVTGDVKTGAGVMLGAALASLKDEVESLQFSMQRIGFESNFRLEAVESAIAFLLQQAGAVAIPRWRSKQEVEEGDDMGIANPPAAELGLIVEYQIDQRNPNFQHEEVISITPPAGTVVLRGSTVVVKINLEG
jgi:hypothetical protein